jgi:hypothetical protein
MEKKKTKEDLVAEIAVLKRNNDVLASRDEDARREFAKAFHWQKRRGPYDHSSEEVRIPTWSEVYVELGKILAARDFRNWEGNISELEVAVENMRRQIKQNYECFFPNGTCTFPNNDHDSHPKG